MAKTQTAHIVITANAKAAVEVMKMLKEQTDIYINRLDALTQKKKQGVQLTKAEEKEAKELEKKIQALTTAQQKNQAEYRKTRDVMKNIAGSTTKDLKRAYAELAKMLNSTTGEQTKRQEILRKKMQEVKAQIDKNTGAINSMSKAQSGFGGALKATLKNLVAYAGVFAIFGKVKSLLGDVVNKNKELSDSMANIRKVSQWTSADVVKLTENMAKIDTRNTLATLQNLAYQGAKLGIGQYGVEGLTGFVRAAEQVQTALGEDLGEEALPALAKLTEVMGLIPKFGVEQAMQKAGSAIYQLGATSTATGSDIIEFSKRIMGLANVAGVTSDQLLGLAGASSTMAIMPEVGATAFNKLFNSIHANTEGIAKAVGLAKEELTSLLYEGRTMDALVKVFEKMQTMSMAEMEGRGVFKELGSDGARLTNVMITMANKVDMLKKSLETSNHAFSEGRAVINEYMIQQETAAAYFERASNIWEKAFINPEGVDVVKQLAQEWYNVSYEMTHSASTMASIKNTLELIAGTVKLLITYLPTLIQLMMAYGVGAALQSIVLQYRAIKLAALEAGGAAAKFNALMKTNAIALAITGVLMLIMKYKDLKAAEEEVAAAEERRNTIMADTKAEALQVYNEQKKALDKYYDALKNTNATEDERNDIIRQFKSEFGSYLEKLGIEINTYKDMEDALHRVNKELKDKAFYETGQKLRESYVGDAKQTQTNALSQYMQAAQKYNLPTKLMEDIVEGNVKTVDEAMQRVQQELNKGANGSTLTLNGNRFGLGGWQDVRTEENKTVGDRVKDFLFGNKTPKADQQTTDIYHAINNLVTATQEVNSRENQVTKFLDQYADKYSPNISVDGALLNLKRLKELNEDKLNEGLNVLRDEWKKMSETDRKSERGVQIGGAIDQYSKQIRSLRGEGYTPPPTKKEINAAKSARLEKLRSDFKQTKENADGLIAKIDEWYNLQEAAVKDAEAMGQMSKQNAEDLVKMMEIARNQSLAKARKAVGSGEQQAIDDWQTWAKTVLPSMLADSSEWSAGLMNTIQQVDAKALHDFLKRFDGSKAMAELDASSFLDTIMKKGAGSLKKAQVLRAQFKERTDKYVEQYQVIDTAQRKMQEDLQALGIMTETYEEMAQRIAENREKGDNLIAPSQQRVERTATAFTNQQGREQYSGSPQDMGRWLTDLSSQKGAEWTAGLPQVRQWLSDVEKYKGEIAAFYQALTDYEQAYLDKNEDATREAANRLSQLLTARISDAQAYNAMGLKFVGQGTIPYTIDITNQQEALQWLKNFATDGEGELEQWAQAFPQITDMVTRIKEAEKDGTLGEAELQSLQDAMPQIEALYLKLVNYSDSVGKNIEQQVNAMMPSRAPIGVSEMTQQYNQRRSLTESLYQQQIDQANAQGGPVDENSDNAAAIELKRQRDQALIDMEYQFQQQLWQIREQMGTTVFEQYDNEVAKYKNMLDKKLISERQFQQKKGQLQMKLGLNMAQQYNGMMSNMVNALQEAEIASVEAKYDAEISAAQAAGQDTAALEEQKEAEIYEVRKKYAGLQFAVKISEIIANTAVAIMQAFAQLGPVGGAIAAAMLTVTGAAQLAIAKAEYDKVMSASAGGKKTSTASTTSTPKTKFVSGMLSYDEGNADTAAKSSSSGDRSGVYPGTDGHIYRATPQPVLPDGVQLIRRPIATTVNGQPSLVAERGPEIIIGRRATRHIQMNEPGLLHHLAAINGRYRTYDQGTVPAGMSFASPSEATATTPDGSPSGDNPRVAAALEQNTQMMLAMQQTIAALSQTVTTLQQRGIRAHIQKYGADGLIEEVKSGLKFDQRYNR